MKWPALRPSSFTPTGINLGAHWMAGWVGLRNNLNAVENRQWQVIFLLPLMRIDFVIIHPSAFQFSWQPRFTKYFSLFISCILISTTHSACLGLHLCELTTLVKEQTLLSDQVTSYGLVVYLLVLFCGAVSN
jgi:hypothetical protein